MEEKECRICFSEENPEKMIAPCYCKGTSKWVHLKCLNNWRYFNNQIAKKKCMECNFEYEYLDEIIYKYHKCDKIFDFILKTDYLLFFNKICLLLISFFCNFKKYNIFKFKFEFMNNYIFILFNYYLFFTLFILLSLLFVKNKSQYFKMNRFNFNKLLVLFIVCFFSPFISYFLFISIIGLLFREILVGHLKTIYIIRKNSDNNIKSFH